MKTSFIHVQGKKNVDDIKLHPEMTGRVGLVATVQYMDLLDALHDSVIGGQVLGCNASNALRITKDVDCFLFIGEGRFHPIRIAQETGKPVFVASGEKIDAEEIAVMERRKKGRQLKYLHASKVGILQTLKAGQRFGNVQAIREKVVADGKTPYVFLDDTFDLASLENFNDIDIFINTACPRLEGSNVIAAEDLPR